MDPLDTTDDLPASVLPTIAEPAPVSEQTPSQEAHNVVVLGCYDIVIRIGWIFKTESVIMPAVLDQVAGAGWLRGLLPVVNRLGMSIPPAFYAPGLRRMAIKKRSLALWTVVMGLVFLTLAAVWQRFAGERPTWMAGMFLALYATFSAAHGINQLSYGTVTGKLVSAHGRGRLMSWSLPIGATAAVLFAWQLMGRWLRSPDGGFVWIFGFTGICFLLAGLVATRLREPSVAPPNADSPERRSRLHAIDVLWKDANFRRFAAVAMLSSTTVILFPHYQALARQRLGLANENLMIWVVVQNLAVAVFGLFVGRIVHRSGERLAVRVALFGTALAPLAAVWLSRLDLDLARAWYWLVFIPIGMTPISQKTMLGYTLEASATHDHPRYLSALSMCQALPFLVSPGVGWLVDRFGFEAVFLVGSALLVAAAALTWRIDEPRDAHPSAAP